MAAGSQVKRSERARRPGPAESAPGETPTPARASGPVAELGGDRAAVRGEPGRGAAGTQPPAAAAGRGERLGRPRARAPRRTPVRGRRRRVSLLTLRILAINVLALAILFGGLLYLDQYRAGLIEAKVAGLTSEARIIAGALGGSAVAGDPEALALDGELTRQLVGRLVEPARARARVFAEDGGLLVDSRELVAAGRQVQTAVLPPPGETKSLVRAATRLYDWIADRLQRDAGLPLYNEAPDQRAEDYRETAAALDGDEGYALRVTPSGGLVISVAVPVQHFKKVLGALMLTTDGADIRKGVREVRFAIIQVFLLALAITVLLSLFLAGTIARPVTRLAQAARKVRHGYHRREEIPDFTGRRDEIGDLSGALAEMTRTLYRRLDAIESFAADVAHELKNPLTSLHSAVESLPRVSDPAQRQRLIEIIDDDVARLNRLISDISNASRLDAELSRAESGPVDVGGILRNTVEAYRATAAERAPRLELEIGDGRGLVVDGIEDRLGQVVHNLIANAISFSPPDGVIRIAVRRHGGEVVLTVEDDGPGFPEKDLEAVFERFYTLRPEEERFGTHSGLGLSISRQIVEAHGGTIRAENRRAPSGQVAGARLVVCLPA